MSYNIGEELKKCGLKNTKHRVEILDILKHGDQPVSAEQIFTEMLGRNINVNFSTVYRTLDTLCEKDLVVKLTIAGGNGALYEFNSMVHKHHLICLGCKKIISLDYCPLGNYEQALAEKTDYIIAGHKLDIYGY
ncbi:MAG: transcriptional repressor, partial [Clostridia bacterium]|nr:transcriptional repressor [Clostridia bacterium]